LVDARNEDPRIRSPSSIARQQSREEEDLLGERAWRRASLIKLSLLGVNWKRSHNSTTWTSAEAAS
jgi:hypothetical protein